MIPSLSPVSIAVTILRIASVRIIAHMVALTEDPEAVPTHRVGCVVVELVKWNLEVIVKSNYKLMKRRSMKP